MGRGRPGRRPDHPPLAQPPHLVGRSPRREAAGRVGSRGFLVMFRVASRRGGTADAPALGAGARKGLEVQILSPTLASPPLGSPRRRRGRVPRRAAAGRVGSIWPRERPLRSTSPVL